MRLKKYTRAFVHVVITCVISFLMFESTIHQVEHSFEDLADTAHCHHADEHCIHLSKSDHCIFCATGPIVTSEAVAVRVFLCNNFSILPHIEHPSAKLCRTDDFYSTRGPPAA